jgi:GNAT superfamily N-acetyltransferase
VLEAAKYSAIDLLRNGRRIEIRALRPDDRSELVAAVGRSSAQSLYRRFFGVRRHFTEQEIAFFTKVDFINHVALVAMSKENGRPVIVGGGRYVVLQPGKAEVAFAVVDQYQGQGIGAALMRHLVAIARETGIKELTAEVLPDNIPMWHRPLAWPLDSAVGVEASFAGHFTRTLLVWIGSVHGLALGYCRLPPQACVCFVKLKESLHYQKLWPDCSARMSALEGNMLQNPFAAPRKRNYRIRACGTWCAPRHCRPLTSFSCCRGRSAALFLRPMLT